ncbi:two-component sensor histidine kinase [Labrys miyagiensis]
MVSRLRLASMRTQILLLAVLPIFLLASFATVHSTVREAHHRELAAASSLATKIAIAANRIHAATSPVQLQAALDETTRNGLSAALTERRFVDEFELRPIRVDADAADGLLQKLLDLIQASHAEVAPSQSPVMVVRIDDTRSVIFRPDIPALPSLYKEVMANMVLSTLVVLPVVLLSYFLSYRLTRPLIEFAADAQRISGDEDSKEPFTADGALEVRSLRDSLNVMQARIQRMTERRTMMLRSLGHDLRTPLTRLRMRAERSPEGELRTNMLNDISTLAAMIDETMLYLKSIYTDPVPAKKVDLASLLQTIADDYADIEVSVSFSGPPRLVHLCKPRDLARAIQNLIDNASRYATHIDLVLRETDDGEVVIEVCDDGPGLADDLKQEVFEPFFKADTARTVRDNGGLGLGLSITNSIAKTHGGSLRLLDRQPHGLVARITLPAGKARELLRTNRPANDRVFHLQ